MTLNELKDIDRKIIDLLLTYPAQEDEARMTNSELTEEIENAGKSWVSKRLKFLAEEGFVDVEEEGRKKYYTLSDDYSEILRLMNTKEKDAEFIRETPVEVIKSKSLGNMGRFKIPAIAEYNRAERAELSDIELDFNEMKEKFGAKATAEDVIMYAAQRQFEKTEGVRETLSETFDEMVEEGFTDEEREKVLEAKEKLLDVFVENTEYSDKGGVKATLPIRSETVTVKGDSLGDVYSSVPDNEIFPDVDSQEMRGFLKFFDGEVRDAMKSAIVLKNY